MAKQHQQDLDDLTHQIAKLASAQKKHLKHLKTRNHLAKAQINQDSLKFEQTERLYLLEKSKLQPKFKLNVTEFLLCEADFMNDPEQAGEAKFLADRGIEVDERILRFQVNLEHKGQYLRPRLIISRDNIDSDDDLAFSMHDRLYFLPFSELSNSAQHSAFDAYWVYQDQTTLPVIQKHRITQQKDSSLMRWNAVHEDTVFALSKRPSRSFTSSESCRQLFQNRF